ncbi:hypothetical protein [Salinisphaera orenii]
MASTVGLRAHIGAELSNHNGYAAPNANHSHYSIRRSKTRR